MVVFVLTNEGYHDIKSVLIPGKHAVWLSSGVVDEPEINALRTFGVNVTVFYYKIESHDSEAIEEALCTISKHHSGDKIWCEQSTKTHNNVINAQPLAAGTPLRGARYHNVRPHLHLTYVLQ